MMHRMRGPVVARVVAVGLAATTFLPWFTTRGSVDATRYSGNPFPVVDWVVAGVAVAAALVLALRTLAAVVGAVSAGLTLLAFSVDRAEGLPSSIEYGLVLAAVASILLWLGSRRS
jgi:hypothetical protein